MNWSLARQPRNAAFWAVPRDEHDSPSGTRPDPVCISVVSGVPFFRSGGPRLTRPLSPLMEGVYPPDESFARVQMLGIHAFDKAHVVGLSESGLIPLHVGQDILRGLRQMEAEEAGPIRARLEAGGYLHSGEQYLRAKIGADAAGWIHLARSSGDLTTVSLRISQRAELLDLAEASLSVVDALLDIAEREADTVVIAYTHLQHAQPSTVGHQYAAWATEAVRRANSIVDLLTAINASPAGAAVGTGSPFEVPVERIGALLGFEGVFLNSRDSNFAMDAITECVSRVALLANLWARISNELQLWSSDEFRYVDIPEEFCTTSSILPQKKNPIALQYVRGIAGTTAGSVTSALQITSQLADTVIIDRELAAKEMFRSLASTTQASRIMRPLLAGLRFDRDEMLRRARSSWSIAYDLAVVFVRHGVNWRRAHEASAALVRQAVEERLAPQDVTAKWLMNLSYGLDIDMPVYPEELLAALDVLASVTSKRVRGGPRPDDVHTQLATLREAVTRARREMESRRGRVRAAANNLEVSIDTLLARNE